MSLGEWCHKESGVIRRVVSQGESCHKESGVIRRVVSQGSICNQNCQDHCFIVLGMFLAITNARAKKKGHFSGHNL